MISSERKERERERKEKERVVMQRSVAGLASTRSWGPVRDAAWEKTWRTTCRTPPTAPGTPTSTRKVSRIAIYSSSVPGRWELSSSIIAEEREEYDPTGGAAYRKCCKMLGIIPVSHLLRDLLNKETSISLRHHGLGPKGAKAVSAALAVSQL